MNKTQSAVILGGIILLANISIFFGTACATYKECVTLPIPTDEYIGSISATMIPTVESITASPSAIQSPTDSVVTPTNEVTRVEESHVTTTPYLTPQEIAVQEAPFTGRGK